MNGLNISNGALSAAAPRVRVVGVGDTGVKAASGVADSLRGLADVICIDTDEASLRRAGAARRILLGEKAFHGFGSGGDTSGAERAARAQISDLIDAVAGSDCVIILAGMGGTAGSGVAPVVAAAAKLAGAHVFAVASMPFEFEGARRQDIARESLAKLKSAADAVAPLSNDSLIAGGAGSVTMNDALNSGRRLQSDITLAVASLFSSSRAFKQVTPGHVLSTLSNNSLAFAGAGEGAGQAPAAEAVEAALRSPSAIDTGAETIDRAILLLESGPGLSLTQAAAAMGTAQSRLGPGAELHMGIRESRSMAGSVKATLLAACRERRRPVVLPERPAARQTAGPRMPVPMFV